MKHFIVTKNEKENIIKTLKEGSDLIAIEAIKKTLPGKCFIAGNKSAIDWDFLDKYLKVPATFSSMVSTRWAGKLSEMPDNHSRYVLAKYLASKDFGCNLTEGIYNQIFAELGYAPAKKNEQVVDKQTVRLVSDRLGIQSDDIWECICKANKAGKTMPTTMIANAIANIQKNITKSKSKKVREMEVKLYADPKIGEVRAYGTKRYRPDITITYKKNGENVLLIAEHFGWTGSQQYTDKETEKVTIAASEGIPMWYTSPFDYPVVIKNAPTNYSSLEKDVYNWTKNNWIQSFTSIDATERCLREMLKYAGLEKFMLPIEELFNA